MWIVELVKKPKINDFRAGFFPRRFHYKKEALELVQEVEMKGGEAVIKKEKKNISVHIELEMKNNYLY